jgi:MFS family permease
MTLTCRAGPSVLAANHTAPHTHGLITKLNPFDLSWRPIFLVNVPVGLVALVASAFLSTEFHWASAPRRPAARFRPCYQHLA